MGARTITTNVFNLVKCKPKVISPLKPIINPSAANAKMMIGIVIIRSGVTNWNDCSIFVSKSVTYLKEEPHDLFSDIFCSQSTSFMTLNTTELFK